MKFAALIALKLVSLNNPANHFINILMSRSSVMTRMYICMVLIFKQQAIYESGIMHGINLVLLAALYYRNLKFHLSQMTNVHSCS